MSNNYSMMHNNFASPLRGATAAVPHNKRDMSNSPYLPKKRSEVIQTYNYLGQSTGV